MTAQVIYSKAMKGNADCSAGAHYGIFSHGRSGLFRGKVVDERASRYFTAYIDDNVWIAYNTPIEQNELIQVDFTALAPWKGIDRMIDNWAGLAADWDADDGIAPRKSSLSALRKFIRRAIKAQIPAPRGYITSDGEIGLKWDAGERIATASFLHDGRFLAYSPRSNGGSVRIAGDYAAADDITDFLQAVRALT